MTSSFLKNFKNLIQKQYSCELTETIKMKQHLHKFKKEYEMKDPDILSRFPKKEFKSFLKIECPISTNDEQLKAQEVQSSLKRLRALNGVREDLVCQNCSKRNQCKVVNQIPEINESSNKTQLSDLLTSLYYFAVEIESKNIINNIDQDQKLNIEQDDISKNEQTNDKDSNKKKNDKIKADISVEKYRQCQTESSFFKDTTSANKLTDTMHIVLDDLYNNLGVETKKFNNEFIEEEKRRRFMERMYKTLEKNIIADEKMRREEFNEKYGASLTEEIDNDNDNDNEKKITKSSQNHKGYERKSYNKQQQEEEDVNEGDSRINKQNRFNNKNERYEKNNNYEKNQSNRKEFYNKDQYDQQDRNNQRFDKSQQQYGSRYNDNIQKQQSYKDNSRYFSEKSLDKSQNNYEKKYERRGESYNNNNNKYDNNERRFDKNDYQSKNEKDGRFNKNYDNKKQFEKTQNNSIDNNNNKQNKPSFDKLQKIDDSMLSKFMFKDVQEQKNRINQSLQQKQYEKEERKASKFEKEVQDIQEIINESTSDKLVREADRKKQPKYSKGPFKFTKTIKKDN